jgi:hypothetical protein
LFESVPVELVWADVPESFTMQVAMHRNAVSTSMTESTAMHLRITSTTASL